MSAAVVRILSAAAAKGAAIGAGSNPVPPSASPADPGENPESIVPPRSQTRSRRPRQSASDRTDATTPSAVSPEPVRQGHNPFEAEASRVLAALSSSLSSLIRALPTPIDGCRELERALGIDHVLAWRTYRIATASDPASVGADVPRPAPMDRLLRAARRRRVAPAVIQSVRDAYTDFEQMVRRHAGDDPRRGPGAGERGGGRAAFDALIGGGRGESSRRLELSHRRALYKSASFIWGMQARCTLTCAVMHPGDAPETVDALILSGFVQAHALRAGTPLRLIGRWGVRPDTPDAAGARAFDAPHGGNQILGRFSSHPLPQVTASPISSGMVESELRFEGIGRSAAIDVFTAKTTRGSRLDPTEPFHGAVKSVSMPSEMLVLDFLIPRGWTDPVSVRTSTHGYPGIVESLAQRLPDFAMPITEHGEYLGSDLGALDLPQIPRHAEMTRSILEDLGWDAAGFDIFRCRVEYPILHTTIRMRVDTMHRR